MLHFSFSPTHQLLFCLPFYSCFCYYLLSFSSLVLILSPSDVFLVATNPSDCV